MDLAVLVIFIIFEDENSDLQIARPFLLKSENANL